jgi:hypothetical protein
MVAASDEHAMTLKIYHHEREFGRSYGAAGRA